MATASSLMREDNFLCSICLEVFTRPVTIPCGHNFCQDCISNHWDGSGTIFKCPLCKEEYLKRPMLRVNSVLAEMAAGVKARAQEKACAQPDQAENGEVLCHDCAGAKCAAVKSCLVCIRSYCQAHLEPHRRISTLKKHTLIPAVENPESRLCKNHDQHLELFCTVCKMFTCKSCKDSDHKSHKTVTLQEEAQMVAARMENGRKELDHMIQGHQKTIDRLQMFVKEGRLSTGNALTYSMQVMNAVADFVKRSQSEIAKVIQSKQQETEDEAAGLIAMLEDEVEQMKQNNAALSRVPVSSDPFVFLENFLSLTVAPLHVTDGSDLTLNTYNLNIKEALTKLVKTVREEIRMLCDPDFKDMQQHAVEVRLDPDTANPSLVISQDGKQVRHGEKKQNLPNKPQRFDNMLNVLAIERFSQGKFYYEVLVKGKTSWDLGVANHSINRKGDIRLTPKNGYWTIWLRKGNELTANAVPATVLSLRSVPQKVGVFVNYQEGKVSFYDVDARACIYCFTGCNFTEELHPFFSPSSNDGGKNSGPLIITPVNCSE